MCVCTWLHCYPPSSNPSGKPRPHTQCACTMTTNSLQLTYQTTALSVFVLLVVSTTRLLITHASQLWMLMELKLSPGWHMSFSPTPDCTNEHVCVCALPGQDCATNCIPYTSSPLFRTQFKQHHCCVPCSSKHTIFLSCYSNRWMHPKPQ